MKSQNERILAYLKRGKSLTALQALDKFDCLALHSRISYLRNNLGHNIFSEMITLKNGKHIAKYSLIR